MRLERAELTRLMQAAREASDHAYVPYSHFCVGAAVITPTGEIFTGSNVENASYGLTMCAERTAVFKAVSSGFTEIAALAVYAPTLPGVFPCGACRQVLNEFGRDALIAVGGANGDITTRRLDELLPSAFGPESLQPSE